MYYSLRLIRFIILKVKKKIIITFDVLVYFLFLVVLLNFKRSIIYLTNIESEWIKSFKCNSKQIVFLRYSLPLHLA